MIVSLQKKIKTTFIKQFFWLIFLCVLISFSTIYVYAERLPIKTYTVADGLLRDYVDKIRQDSRGFLWFCTGEGISRFNGIGMTNFTVADGLPNREVHDFLETKSGTIYIATESGLARLNPHGLRGSKENPLFTNLLPDDPKAEKILTLYEDKNNQIWVGTSNGLYKLIEKGGQLTFEAVELGEPRSGGAVAEPSITTLSVNTILEDRLGSLWIGTFGSGLFRLLPSGFVQSFVKDKDGFGDDKITALMEDRDGQIWMGMRSDKKGGVCILDPADPVNPVKKCYSVNDGLGSNRIRDIFQTGDGQMWLATVPGLCRWQGEGSASVCKTYTEKNDLCDSILTLAEDKDGNLWTGSPCGAKKIARYGFTTYKADDGLNDDHVNNIFENSSGELFATAFPKVDRVISRFNGDNFSLLKLKLPDYVDYHGWGWQQTVWQDSRGAWWIPTGYGLFRSPDNTSFENLVRAPLEKLVTGAKGLEPFRLFEDSRGDIWMATVGDANQLLRWERAANTWHDYTSQVGLSQSGIGSAFAEDSYGNVWIGISSEYGISSLIRYRNGEFRILSEKKDSESNPQSPIPNPKSNGSPSGWIWDLFLDSRGRLWIGSTNNGLWRLDEPNSDSFEFIKYTSANGLTSDAATSVTEDAFGRIYIGSWRGVDRLNPDTGQVENFTTADGLPASFVEVSYRDRQNNLWFGTDNGIARFVPEPPRTRQPPTILITGLRVNGESQNISVLGESAIQKIELNSDQKQISVEFLGLGASLGEKLKYEYRFGEADWTATTERTLNFANLTADNYRLEVRAQTADGIYSTTPASLSFRIAAPFWQRWWFLLGTIILIAGIVYLIYKYRLRRVVELEKVRTRIATDLHDDIGANLTRISLLSEVARQKAENGSGQMLSSIADIARESVASMNDIVWAIAPEHDSLLDLTRRMRQHAEEVFALRDIDLEFNAAASDLKLSVGVRRDLLLIFKEAVNNAAKHSDCTKVWIDFGLENSVLKLRIRDNGKGFSTDLQTDGQGLRSMTRRAESLKGKLNILAESGTTVELEMVLH